MPKSKTPSGPGRPKDLAKRDAILEAAKCLFLQKGYDGSSMDAIASDAGVSKLTVYNHFQDKETLFSAAVKSKCEEQLPELLFDLPDNAPIETTLLNIGRNFHALVNSRESVELHRVMLSQANHDPKLSMLFFEAGPQRVMREMARLLARANQLGKLSLPDPQVAADQFLCLIKGTTNFRMLLGCCAPPTDRDSEREIANVVSFFLRAYAPR